MPSLLRAMALCALTGAAVAGWAGGARGETTDPLTTGTPARPAQKVTPARTTAPNAASKAAQPQTGSKSAQPKAAPPASAPATAPSQPAPAQATPSKAPAQTATPAPTATPAKPPAEAKPVPEAPMRVTLVRSALPGCEPDCPEWIAALGRIDTGTPARFRAALKQAGTRKLPILIDSSGGAVTPALAIGRLIREKQLDIVVTRTELVACAPKDTACHRLRARGIQHGVPKAYISKCASACAFLMAGGVRRYVGPGTVVGVHKVSSFQIYTRMLQRFQLIPHQQFGGPVRYEKRIISETKVSERTVPVATPDQVNDEVRRYFVEMGVSEDVMTLVLRTPAERMHWLRPGELRTYRIATDFINGEQLLHPAAAAAAAASAPPAGAAPPHWAPGSPHLAAAGCYPAAGIVLGCRAGGAGADASAPIAATPSISSVAAAARALAPPVISGGAAAP